MHAAGLTRDLHEPWVGLHDWNGAFFSQLARNFLRYPFSIHHGMPMVGVGAATPPPEERSLYPRHPPALVWLVAGAFQLCGESEDVARGVPIVCSLGSLALIVSIVARARDRRTAVVVGSIFAILPMTVYYGRMVNHEAVCLFFMLATLSCWQRIRARPTGAEPQRVHVALWFLSLIMAAWIDWTGILFGAVFLAAAGLQWKQQRMSSTHVFFVMACALVSTFSVLVYLSYAGFDGQWADMIAMFRSRQESVPDRSFWEPFHHAQMGLTWPILGLCAASIAMGVRRVISQIGKHSDARSLGTDSPTNGPTRSGRLSEFGIITVTGLIWVLLFWRQFQIHEYWMYYLVPGCAAAAGILLTRLVTTVAGRNHRVGVLFGIVVATIIVTCCLRQSALDFASTNWNIDDVEMCRGIANQTRPEERLVVTWNPWHVERHGHFEFKNIIPPQFAYYLDRSFDVVTDPAEIQRRQEQGAYVMRRGQ